MVGNSVGLCTPYEKRILSSANISHQDLPCPEHKPKTPKYRTGWTEPPVFSFRFPVLEPLARPDFSTWPFRAVCVVACCPTGGRP